MNRRIKKKIDSREGYRTYKQGRLYMLRSIAAKQYNVTSNDLIYMQVDNKCKRIISSHVIRDYKSHFKAVLRRAKDVNFDEVKEMSFLWEQT